MIRPKIDPTPIIKDWYGGNIQYRAEGYKFYGNCV